MQRPSEKFKGKNFNFSDSMFKSSIINESIIIIFRWIVYNYSDYQSKVQNGQKLGHTRV